MADDNSSPADVNAQGGQQDTQRSTPQGSYQQGQGQETSSQKQPPGSSPQKKQPEVSAQGGQQDTQREQAQGSYQQGQGQSPEE